jgi:hypothetical protein
MHGQRLRPFHPQDCEDKPGKTRAGANIHQGFSLWGNHGDKLGAVQEMAAPEIAQRLRAYQIDSLLPFDQQRAIGLKPIPCFT